MVLALLNLGYCTGTVHRQILTFGAVRTLLSGVPVLLAGGVWGVAKGLAELAHVLHGGQVLRLVVLQLTLHTNTRGITKSDLWRIKDWLTVTSPPPAPTKKADIEADPDPSESE